jgi:hypothetical protein
MERHHTARPTKPETCIVIHPSGSHRTFKTVIAVIS